MNKKWGGGGGGGVKTFFIHPSKQWITHKWILRVSPQFTSHDNVFITSLQCSNMGMCSAFFFSGRHLFPSLVLAWFIIAVIFLRNIPKLPLNASAGDAITALSNLQSVQLHWLQHCNSYFSTVLYCTVLCNTSTVLRPVDIVQHHTATGHLIYIEINFNVLLQLPFLWVSFGVCEENVHTMCWHSIWRWPYQEFPIP